MNRVFECCSLLCFVLFPLSSVAQGQMWKSADDPTISVDFKYQGEYVGQIAGAGKLGCQVISLSNGEFHAVVYPDGLPGDGWDGKSKIQMTGKLEGEEVKFSPATGKRNYLAGPGAQFSATSKFPSDGHKEYSGSLTGETLSGTTDDQKMFELKKTARESPTLGAKAPAGAIVLFDGSNDEAFNGGRLDEKTKLLNTDGRDVKTNQKFQNYMMHVEFMLPYRPSARGQGRGNSGFYQVDHYEVQVLDSFGLDGKNNECGGIYQNADPMVNMCFPPLTWQSYDIDFTNAVVVDGKKEKKAVITLRHNGVLVHDKVEVNGPTGGSRREPEGTPGPIKFQGHGNPLQYRNIWIVEK
ncbi:MAG: DUF1080 domain-containing protein [Planctomycetota bacterium]|nr:DUF1080 domain-containing protein [Planctomycetota bacterium]MDA1141253.1 DUF1080 domain-containing protein [Planctomycetota bacterium]